MAVTIRIAGVAPASWSLGSMKDSATRSSPARSDRAPVRNDGLVCSVGGATFVVGAVCSVHGSSVS
eukprot:29465-Eustigmatos_ZCMA.PRE.1